MDTEEVQRQNPQHWQISVRVGTAPPADPYETGCTRTAGPKDDEIDLQIGRPSFSSIPTTQWNAISALVSIKLNGDNYLHWRSQLESVMESQDLLEYVDGTNLAPSETISTNGKDDSKDRDEDNKLKIKLETIADPYSLFK
ncbi:hypothetical protein EJ110_NYTH12837 [Nymphaea thermarum]|nr:hypothetical protein EJ110_NYTH12837 [Nymphaea thermarum]